MEEITYQFVVGIIIGLAIGWLLNGIFTDIIKYKKEQNKLFNRKL